MTREEAIDLANDMAFMACIWIDDNSNEVNDVVKLIQNVAAAVRKATLEEMIYANPTTAIKQAVEYERYECAKACMNASADNEMQKAMGDAAHYAACANAILARKEKNELALP